MSDCWRWLCVYKWCQFPVINLRFLSGYRVCVCGGIRYLWPIVNGLHTYNHHGGARLRCLCMTLQSGQSGNWVQFGRGNFLFNFGRGNFLFQFGRGNFLFQFGRGNFLSGSHPERIMTWLGSYSCCNDRSCTGGKSAMAWILKLGLWKHGAVPPIYHVSSHQSVYLNSVTSTAEALLKL
jgi:hypothetical protein